MFLSHIDVFLSLSLPSPLKINKNNLLFVCFKVQSWDLVRHAESQASPQTYSDRLCVWNKISRWLSPQTSGSTQGFWYHPKRIPTSLYTNLFFSKYFLFLLFYCCSLLHLNIQPQYPFKQLGWIVNKTFTILKTPNGLSKPSIGAFWHFSCFLLGAPKHFLIVSMEQVGPFNEEGVAFCEREQGPINAEQCQMDFSTEHHWWPSKEKWDSGGRKKTDRSGNRKRM